jgi:hypothetical protein
MNDEQLYIARETARFCDNRVPLCICGCGLPMPVTAPRRDGRKPAMFLRGHNRRNGAGKHGMTLTPEYTTYHSAKDRCNNKKNPRWSDYGGRGIRFLFSDFWQFFVELGKRPAGTSIDRKDVNGNYEIGNVRWSTAKEQAINKRDTPSPEPDFELEFL